MQEASYYQSGENNTVLCVLCPHRCTIGPERHGKCRTRINHGGKLYTESFGVLSAISTDHIEKKPLYHFHPGRSILSIGSFGCNMTCNFCQNCEISQIDERILSHYPSRDPEDIVNKALLHQNNLGLAYTYNEPTVYYEYMIRCAALVSEQGQLNVMVTNGYLNGPPLEGLFPFMDAFNVDLKSFRNEFYQKTSGATLTPVLDTIEAIARSGKHLELTFLIIPGLNDDELEWADMISWIESQCGSDTVLHVSRYYPKHQMNTPPTPLKTIERFIQVSRGKLHYVYPGNTPQLKSHTYCPGCGSLLIERFLYSSTMIGMDQKGRCSNCSHKINGAFNTLKF